MGLFSRKERGPKLIQCPNCSASQEVSASAHSVVCRHCNLSIKVTDQIVTQYSAVVALETSGSLTIEKKGALVVQQRVAVFHLTVRGSLKGNAVVQGNAHIAAGGQVTGALKARTITIEDGATLKGFLRIESGDAGEETSEEAKPWAGEAAIPAAK